MDVKSMDDIIPTSVDNVGGDPADGSIIIDSGVLGTPNTTVVPVVPKQKRNVFRRLRHGDTYPFLLHPPDAKEVMMYRCLAISKPFATPKYKGITEAWTIAVAEINNQRDPTTGQRVFDPPIAVKPARERFESAMAIVKHLLLHHANHVAFFRTNSGRCDNDEQQDGDDDNKPSSSLMQILAELYEHKTSLEEQAQPPTGGAVINKDTSTTTLPTKKKNVQDDDITTTTLAKKRKVYWDADAKSNQEAATIGVWSCSSSSSDPADDSETADSEEIRSHQKKKQAQTYYYSGERENTLALLFLSATLASVKEKEARRAEQQQADQEFYQKRMTELKQQRLELEQRQAEQQQRTELDLWTMNNVQAMIKKFK
jgi:hypothetical protein